ncbi:glycosyltransferase family protein [Adhaeribacter radiodurans]|uniref:Glycosyltransferase family protein n=2 Tax=Adhaeribacter radiodurans TaxID=2745197 RepID=A0A7L7L863_9BACT|nr:glycosyltransferase family protein [Adhaeribacter radiodurans]
MTSTRLPGKVLLPVKNQPLLKYHTDRLKKNNFPIYLATTTNATDDVIAQFAEQEGVYCYRGNEDNVLSRYYETALENQLDVIVRVTSDCPLVDGDLIKTGVEKYLQWQNETIYLSNSIVRTFPRGFDFEIFSFQQLEEAFLKAETTFQKEHVTPYIKEHAQAEHVVYSEDASDLRITVDTPEDFQLIKILIEDFQADTLSYQEIIKLLRSHPELVKINAHIEQKKG